MKGQDTVRLDPDNWVGDYGDALYGFALARVKNSEVAEDLVQETYFAALRSRSNFKGISSEKTWLFGILKHKILDYFGKSKRTLYLHDVSPHPDAIAVFRGAQQDGRPSYPDDPVGDPEKVYHYKEFLDYFSHCLSNLPRRTAEIFVSREIDGLSTEEICKTFGISRFNCWTILSRAKGRLRENLEFYGFKPST